MGPLQARQDGTPVTIPGAKPRAILTMLGLHAGSVVSAETLVELLWGEDPPRTAAKALQTHISSLRRALGDGFVLTQGAGWTLADSQVDAVSYKSAARLGRDAAAAGDTSQAVARFEEALALWRGIPELPDGRRGTSEKTRWIEGHAALVEDRADALLATGRAAEIIGELEAAVADAPLRERRWGQLMLALYRAGRQGEALGAYQRARTLLADELGVDPGPELRRLEAAIVAQDASLEVPGAQDVTAVTRAVTFLLTDIEGSTAAWEAEADAMAVALARHDELVEQVVTSRGGRLIKTRGEGDATFSVFERPSAAAAAAIELQEAIGHEPWALRQPMRIRVALHTGEVELRDGDYFGRAVNRAARLRSLAAGGQILCSGATAELVTDTLPDDVVLADLGTRQLRNLARPEHVFELQLQTVDEPAAAIEVPVERPALPPVLTGPGPFVGRGHELERLSAAWQTTLAGSTNAVLIAGEPGVGKTRLAGEWSRHAYDQGALIIYGRCDEDLGAPYQPFAEALRALVPCLGSGGLRGLRGVEALLPLVPGLTDVLPDLAAPTRADPDTERYALFDAVVAVLAMASAGAPVVLVLDDLHWAAKPTLLLLRHLLRFGDQARLQIIGTYRSTDLDRSHPLAAMLADLHRDGTATRLALSGLDEEDVTAYVAEAGYNDEDLARALASVTGGNPFFLIEALRHVDESGGRWDQSTLPQGVREAVSRRLSRLAPETNKALAAAAVVGSRFALELVERVIGDDLVDELDEACKAGIVIEEPGGRYRFNHALVRQSLLAELPSVRRMRLHQRIATTLEGEPDPDDELLAELAYHYFECAWAGNAAKAVEYCRRAADQAMSRLAYEGAAELYDRALHALEEIDDELPDRDEQAAALLIARCEALLAAGDVASASGAVSQLQQATVDSARLAAWATCFDAQLSMLIHPERLDEIEAAVGAAAEKLAELDDAAGEAKAHTVRAGCLARLGRIGDGEIALDDALTAARRARDHRLVNNVLANAPLAALWGPNPVPRAGGRCLDVVRLLRITTDSPAVEATSTRCQAVLEAFRGRAEAARRMIDSARRTVSELGLRHALVEVEQFAGIVELVVDEPATAEPHLRKAYNGFRRMGLDADTAETAALLGRTCLALGRDAEAEELCAESERLAGHALKASIAWRTLRARLLVRMGDHVEAKRVAEAAVSLAERTDALVDHADACLGLATVLDAAGDSAGARAAAERAVGLYELKGAVALAERARGVVGERAVRPTPVTPQAPPVELDNACARAGERTIAAIEREDWDQISQMYSPTGLIESRRKIVGFTPMSASDWVRLNRPILESGTVRINQVIVAVRGERLALCRMRVYNEDASPGAPYDEFLNLYGIDEEGLFNLQLWFDLDDIDSAMAELEAAHSRLEERQRPRLQNAASRVDDRLNALGAERRWNELNALFADDVRVEDRRPGFRHEFTGRATALTEARAIAELGAKKATSHVIALRGERLALVRIVFWGRDDNPEAYRTELLRLAEIDGDGRIAAHIVFIPDDFDAAIRELDARYLAGEAAAHPHVWSAVVGAYAAINRREIPAFAPDCTNVDHRRATAFPSGEIIGFVRAGWDLDYAIQFYVEAVHQLSDRGIVLTHKGQGKSPDGFDAEWREVALVTVDGDSFDRCEVFDEEDVDAAVARLEELSRPAPGLQNTASQAYERLVSHIAARDWEAVTAIVADDLYYNDQRRVVNAGIRRGRKAGIEDVQALAAVGFTLTMVRVPATRGERLALLQMRASGREPETIQNDALNIVQIDADGRIEAVLVFDLDDFEAAIAELDARYLAGEAAPHAHTWSVIAGAYAAHNRREVAETTLDLVSIDHRRVASFAPGEGIEYLRAGWALGQNLTLYAEKIHRLSDLGAVFTWAGHATSDDGFSAEWRGINLFTIDGEKVSRSEVFDETDLQHALARFDELSPPAPRLGNTAARVFEHVWSHYAAGDWETLAATVADNYVGIDHRRVLSAETQHGRDHVVRDLRAAADVGFAISMVSAIATRGERLVLARVRAAGRDAEAIQNDALNVVEVDADQRIATVVTYDLEDIDAAIDELDARYLAGEAARYSHTWSVVARTYAATNSQRIEMAPECVSIDHRRGRAFAPGELNTYMRATWDLAPNVKGHIESVHRLNGLGAVVTHVVRGTSREGFDAEWREVFLVTVEGDLINRAEIFDEADRDAAVARLDQLSQQPLPANAASQAAQRFLTCFVGRDWNAMAQVLADDIDSDDRRRVVNAGLQRGAHAHIENLRWAANLGVTHATSHSVATRGERLVLAHTRYSASGEKPEPTYADVLEVIQVNADARIEAWVSFDPDDFDAAFAELDARYLAGEAAAHAHTWSIVMRAYSALNTREQLPTTPEWANIDHRRGVSFPSGELPALLAVWTGVPETTSFAQAVHRLNTVGAVVTSVSAETSREGFRAEWRGISVVTVKGDLIDRLEVFDEADLDAAVARFEQLGRSAPRLENRASQVYEHFWTCFAARDWGAMAEILADDSASHDRRRVVNAGIRHGRDAFIADMRAVAEVGTADHITSTVLATRGERLTLNCVQSRSLQTELLNVVELSDTGTIASVVVFDIEDIASAFEELEARYLAGEAAPYARAWSVIARAFAALNRRELPPTTPHWVNVDHRRGASAPPGEMVALLAASWNDTSNPVTFFVESVHRLSDLGAVITQVVHETSQEGYRAEWRVVILLVVQGDMYHRCEIFDESDLDSALAHFEELHQQAPRPENEATRLVDQFLAEFSAVDWDAMARHLAEDFYSDDRRPVVNLGVRRGRDDEMANWRATSDVWSSDVKSRVVATRGQRLGLFRFTFAIQEHEPEKLQAAGLGVVEINDDGQVAASVVFDPDDHEAAIAELDARYLAGEAAQHARTWSVVAENYAALNRHEIPPTSDRLEIKDHRRVPMVEPDDRTNVLHAGWDLIPNFRIYAEAVHRLNSVGAVVERTTNGTSRDGLDAEWRVIDVFTVQDGMVNRCEIFDEQDLSAALARFDELTRPGPLLHNAASHAAEHYLAHLAAGDANAIAEILAENVVTDDRRRMVGAGIRRGREAQLVDARAIAALSKMDVTSSVSAVRGERLVLLRAEFSGSDQESKAILTEVVVVLEIDTDGRVLTVVSFDPDDIDAAFAELDARYLAAEAAAHAHTWTVVSGAYAAMNRRELFPTTPDWANVDHRRPGMIEEGGLNASLGSLWELMPDLTFRIEAVHRLTNLGAVCSHVAHGISQDGFDAEWRGIELLTITGSLVDRCEIFDAADLDNALATFDQLSQSSHPLQNTASTVAESFLERLVAGDWDAVKRTIADEFSQEDRRRVVGAGVRPGRDAEIADLRAIAELGLSKATVVGIATRGERLTLMRVRFSFQNQGAEPYVGELLGICEIDAEQRIVGVVALDLDDIDAAFNALEARYLAGAAAAHARTWSVITNSYAGFNRHELPPMDWVTADHRRATPFRPSDMTPSIRTIWELTPDLRIDIESVHRLNGCGAVITHQGHGRSLDGFEAEWRAIDVLMVDGEVINRCEVFDEDDIDSAIAAFERLCRAPRLQNTASRVDQRSFECFKAHDWDGLATMLAEDFYSDDRRHAVNYGRRSGRDVALANSQASVAMGFRILSPEVLATRGNRLVLSRTKWEWSEPDQRPEGFHTDGLNVVEIDSDERITARIWFEPDDFDAAIAELDARHVAGEAAPYAHVYRLGNETIAELNRHQPGPMLGRLAYVDHRRVPFGSGEEFRRAAEELWKLAPDARYWVKTVHAIDTHGDVVTLMIEGTDAHGNELQWGRILVFETEEPRIEVFDEDDLAAALARFEELRPRRPRLDNAASRAHARFFAHYGARDWDAVAATLADRTFFDDRRRAVNAGTWRGRDVVVTSMRAFEIAADITLTVLATRGNRLALSRLCSANRDLQHGEFDVDLLGVVEVDADGLVIAHISFDVDDTDAAFAELETRYAGGEGAAHAPAWTLIASGYAALNRHGTISTTPDYVNVDHRLQATIEATQLPEYLRAAWNLMPSLNNHVESVHRLSDTGAVVTHVAHGTSEQGFDAEWRTIEVVAIEGGSISRSEMFDEADIDAALARFDELQASARRLGNAATRVAERFFANVHSRNWAAIAEILSHDSSLDDRRRVVNGGLWDGRDVVIANMRAIGVGGSNIRWSAIATRGERLALTRIYSSNLGMTHGEFENEMLGIVEINSDDRVKAQVLFSADDFDAALAELETRYIAGEAAPHARAWSLVTQGHAEFNRHQLPAMTPDVVYVDHRQGVTIEGANLPNSIRAVWDLLPRVYVYVETVHRLTELGAVATQVVRATSQESFDAEWQTITIFTFEGDRLSRYEVFDETDVDTALARFDELQPHARRLENEATRAEDRFFASYKAHDWGAVAQILADGSYIESRVRVVNTGLWAGRDVVIANMRALADSVANTTSTVIAIRGDRLALSHMRHPNRDSRDEDFAPEQLIIVEIDTNERIAAHIVFDVDDMNAAFEELDARYLADEAAAHAETWSVITRECAAFNRRELPKAQWVTVDHRQLVTVNQAELLANIRATWDLMPDIVLRIEVVHRLSDLGAVFVYAAQGTTAEGFAAEWRMIHLVTIEDGRINRNEMFDETDLDAALARFEELRLQPPQPENAATQVEQRFNACFAARDWATMATLLSDDVVMDDRRRVVNGGIRRGRDAEIASERAVAEVGVTRYQQSVVAIRGRRLALSSYSISDGWSGSKVLGVSEINGENQFVARVIFDHDDIDAAFEELETRYLAGEAADHADTWRVFVKAYAGYSRGELPPTTPHPIYIDHRRLVSVEGVELAASLHALLDLTSEVRAYVEAVHRLTEFGAVITQVVKGVWQEGSDTESRMIGVFTIEGESLSRAEIFDEADVDGALALFDALNSETSRLRNAASQVIDYFQACFIARDWEAMAGIFAEDVAAVDHRPIMRAGTRHGRYTNVSDWRSVAAVGFSDMTSTVIATRGQRLALGRFLISTGAEGPHAFHNDVLGIVQLDSANRVATCAMFDPDDRDAAFAELDARYLAGEAAAYAPTWEVITRECAAFNRHELPTADWVTVDHRRLAVIDAREGQAAMRDIWEVTPNLDMRIQAVHRLSKLGAVCSYVASGTSPEGVDVEWPMILLLIVEGDRITRCEIFDEEDLDAALSRFDELGRPVVLENAATRIWARAAEAINRRNAEELLGLASADHEFQDRRKGLRDAFEGPATGTKALRAMFETVPSSWRLEVELLAIRGTSLLLARERYRDIDDAERPIAVELLQITAVGDDGLLRATVLFDAGDVEAAFDELEARYLAGEAAAHSHTWSVIARAYAAFNRHELSTVTPEWVNIDHRRGIAFAPGEMTAYIRAGRQLTPDSQIYVESVHRLTDLGAVVTQVMRATSHDGFDAEWREIGLLTTEGDSVSRSELFDEDDLDAALARFDELVPQRPLENSATRTWLRMADAFNRRDLDGFLALTSGSSHGEDRRKGLRAKFDEVVQPRVVQAMFDAIPSWRCEVEVIATRGNRFALTRNSYRDTAESGQPITSELLTVVEVNDDGTAHHYVSFDPDDINGAFRELTDQWIASGEVAHPEVIKTMGILTEITNRHDSDELTTRVGGATYATHRQLAGVSADTIANYLSSRDVMASLVPDFWIEVSEVLQHSAIGLVANTVMKGTSADGVPIEIELLQLILVEGDRVTHVETFDPDQRELALARFDELNRSG